MPSSNIDSLHVPRMGLTTRNATPINPPVPRPPNGAPNVVAIVLDDTGFAHLGCFGSDIKTPAMDALAQGGLRYRSFHVTALCSPTRASFLTGRNHHAVGMGFLTDIPMGFPGYTARIPKSAATLPRILKDAGYSTMAVGKWHLTPRFERSASGPFDYWPLGMGFERFYGFLNGDANHWAPTVISDNHYVEPPPTPGPDYHLSEDLADTAIKMVLDQQQATPTKPFFLYFALGAMHAPHHVAKSWVEPYHTKFDLGWDEWRKEIFARQKASGIVPEDTVLTPRPQWVDAWDDLSQDEKKMHAREQEVFAGFLTHTDAQIGRVIESLEVQGLLENTIVLVFSDNGASAEGGKHGSLNEHRFTARIPESTKDNLAVIDEWGGPSVYNHYSWGWAWAGNTPMRMWKRYTWLGGTRTPLIISWPKGIETGLRGSVRPQFTHAIDLAPTLLEAIGIESPKSVDGVTQQRVDGASILSTLTNPTAPSPRLTQYFEMLGSRSIYHDGWKATTDHISQGILDEEELAIGSRKFTDDNWELFDLKTDFSESTNQASSHPELLSHMQELWIAEASKNQVLPIDDGFGLRIRAMIPPAWPPGPSRRFVPGANPVCDESVPILFGGFQMTADISVPKEVTPNGVIFALGDWSGGYALFVDGGSLVFTFSRAGEILEVVSNIAVPQDVERVGISYTTTPDGAKGDFVLLIDDKPVGHHGFVGMIPIAIQHGGAGLRLGYDAGLPVSLRYSPPFAWNGTIGSLLIDTPGGTIDLDDAVRAALHAD